MRSAIWYLSLLPRNSYCSSSAVVLSCCHLFCCFVSFFQNWIIPVHMAHHVFYIMFSPCWGEWPSYITIYPFQKLHLYLFLSRSMSLVLPSESVETDCKNTCGIWNVYLFSGAGSVSWLTLCHSWQFKGCWGWGCRRRCVSVHRCSNIRGGNIIILF